MISTAPCLLAIESSCDDTAAAVLCGLEVKSNVVSSQWMHTKYGGVVPELASRAHQTAIVEVVEKALQEADIKLYEIDGIVCTQGPGLLGSLLVGHSFAKSLSLALGIPFYNAHHMRAHILAHFLQTGPNHPGPSFPFLCLTASGGHTQLVVMRHPLEMEIIGETMDDAVGEAFDKAAKMLRLGYPGGPHIDRWAQGGRSDAFAFAKPKISGLQYSFSGLKTSILQVLTKEFGPSIEYPESLLPDLCASIQKALLDHLIEKVMKAMEETKLSTLAIAGGVSANSSLRSQLTEIAKEKGWSLFLPPMAFTMDNAAMIGADGYFQWLYGEASPLSSSAQARPEAS